MKPVIFHRSASVELDAAIARYEDQVPGLGLSLQAEVERVVNLIEQNTRIGAPYKSSGFRHVLVRRFPYVLYYLDMDDAVWVAAVAHVRRRPEFWKERKPPKSGS